MSIGEANERVREALRDQGFGIITEIDVRATMREKLGVEFRDYLILGACNPRLAYRALGSDLSIGLLLPCNVILYDRLDGTCAVEVLDPDAALSLVGDQPDVVVIAAEARARMRAALASLASP
jgi:uncharacterized protein (DUF302 family)